MELSIGYGELKPNNGPVVIWPQFETKRRHVDLHASDDHGDVIRIDIHYKDADGELFTATLLFVRISKGEHPEFEIQPCDPGTRSFIV